MSAKSRSSVIRTRRSAMLARRTASSVAPERCSSPTVCASWPRPTSVAQISFGKFSSSLNFTNESTRNRDYSLTSQVRGIGEGGRDVLWAQTGVLLQDFFGGGAVCKVVEDDSHRDARSVEA